MDRCVCGLLQRISFRDTEAVSQHCGLSGTASEDRSELPQPAIYSSQSEYSEYAFTEVALLYTKCGSLDLLTS